MPYYWGLPLLALVLILWHRLPRAVWYVGMVLVLLTFVWSTYLAGYHAGVEYGFWPGPTACTGTGVDVSFSDLTNINAARVVPCDKIQFSLFGVTLAGFNVLITLAIIAMLAGAMLMRGKKAA